MKKLIALSLLVSFGASAKNLCFEVRTDYPVAIDITVKNRLGQTTLQRLEMMPLQYFCKSYSDMNVKSLSYLVHGFDASCIGVIQGRGNFSLVVSDNGCRVIKGQK